MRRAVPILCALAALPVLAALAGCGGGSATPSQHATPGGTLAGVVLTAEDRAVWAPLPPDRSRIPVLVYHGIAPAGGFRSRADAAYGLDPDDFAKQMALLHHAGYRTVTLDQFARFMAGERVSLPARPLLLTFDDARADSLTGADDVLRRLGFGAVMFVDVGAVERRDPEYLDWGRLAQMQRSGRWDLQLHAGRGHHNIRYGAGARDVGPFYAYRVAGETFARWRRRVESDLAWGARQLAAHVPGARPLAFAPPYGNYGQTATNDARIPRELGRWLARRYRVIFTQDRTALNRPGVPGPAGRLQLTRRMSGGDLHAALAGTG